MICRQNENAEYFAATIGGLGLTGFISWAEIQLIKIPSPFIKVETTVFYGLEEFKLLSEQANTKHRYSVAWLDCTSRGKQFARGLFISGDHISSDKTAPQATLKPMISIPFNLPKQTINRYLIKSFNTLNFHRNRLKSDKPDCQHYNSFFYPLDGIGNWNRIYGRQRFYQYQFVIPLKEHKTVEKFLRKITASKLVPFLTVMKQFGNLESPGMLSFPRPGICLALDFPNHGNTTLKLFKELDRLVIESGGATYPAKDRRMSGEAFRAYYPNHEQFAEYIDPQFSSDFWRRVSE